MTLLLLPCVGLGLSLFPTESSSCVFLVDLLKCNIINVVEQPKLYVPYVPIIVLKTSECCT